MSLALVKKIRAKYPTPLGAKHALFLIELAQTKGAGLLKKTNGTRIRLPKPWNIDVSQDILCIRELGVVNHYDVLKDGEGAAKPAWNLVGPIDPERYVDVSNAPAPIPVPEPEPPAPVPPAPVPPCQCAEVVEMIAANELRAIERQEAVMTVLARLENDNRKPRTFTGSARIIGTMTGSVGGV
jgi:hypothetical protein